MLPLPVTTLPAEKTVGWAAKRPRLASSKAKSSPRVGIPGIGSGMLPIDEIT